MNERILSRLEPVRRRQFRREIVRFAAIGLLAGSLFAIWLGILRWQKPEGDRVTFWAALAFVLAGPALGAIAATARGRSTRAAAAAVDAHYDLKDRAVSAVDFLGKKVTTPIHALQVADADQHLLGLDPYRVVPFKVPAVLPFGAAAAILAIGLLLWPRPAAVHARPADPLEPVIAAAEQAEESLEDLEEAAKRENDPKLKELVQKLTVAIEQMKQPGVDVKEALAKLSEMQAAITAQQANFNVGLVDTQMQALGEALASTEALDGAGQSLQAGKYDKAADQLEQADPKFDRKEVKNLKEKLAKAAKQMEEAGLADLSTATTELAEALESEGSSQSALKKLSNLARAQGRRKRLNDMLTLSNNSLSECKGNCNKGGGIRIRKKSKRDTPTSGWDRSISGNVDGDRTRLDSERKRDQVKGQMGEGDSETETTHMPEGRQTAARKYSEQYQKYRRMSEAALNSEPIPLGHRQTIRRYFELIRPQGDEAEKADAAPRTP
jgi:tetratricopeptide (TPR) repeat protein